MTVNKKPQLPVNKQKAVSPINSEKSISKPLCPCECHQDLKQHACCWAYPRMCSNAKVQE